MGSKINLTIWAWRFFGLSFHGRCLFEIAVCVGQCFCASAIAGDLGRWAEDLESIAAKTLGAVLGRL